MKEMYYTPSFKDKVDNTFMYHKDHKRITDAISQNKHSIVRAILEDALDDTDLNIDEEIKDDGSRIVFNAKIRAKKKREELYSEFMKYYK